MNQFPDSFGNIFADLSMANLETLRMIKIQSTALDLWNENAYLVEEQLR